MSLVQELARSVGMAPTDADNGVAGDGGDDDCSGCGGVCDGDTIDDGCGNGDRTFFHFFFGSIGPSDILETNSAREMAAYPPRILMSMKLAMEDRVCRVNKYI